ncbi:hypothetical protein [Alistipes putredinis]|uniref:hypothetical protein n=1 Tax=Alistipes putredinis TaxID=28117 RepID=UPI003A9343BE
MEDLVQFRLSSIATDIANDFAEKYFFDDNQDAAKFGMAYALKYCRDEIDIESILTGKVLSDDYNNNGSNYSVGGIDPDGKIASVVKEIYPDCTTPYRYVRILMIYGLVKLRDRISSIEELKDLLLEI